MASFRKRVTGKGEIRWQAIVRYGGKRITVRDKPKIVGQQRLVETFGNKQTAKAWAREMEAGIASGKYVRNDAGDITLAAAVERRLQRQNINPRNTTARHLAWWADPERLGNMSIGDITRGDIESWLDVLRATPKLLGGAAGLAGRMSPSLIGH